MLSSGDEEDENMVAPPPSTIHHTRVGPETPSTLGDRSFESPTRAAARARAAAAAGTAAVVSVAAAAAAAPNSPSQGGRAGSSSSSTSSSSAAEVEAEEAAPVVTEQQVETAVATRMTKRQYDHTVRDQVRSYYEIMNEGGSYDKGGDFRCTFCKKKTFKWNTVFNVTLAKTHLLSQCDSCPIDIDTWIRETASGHYYSYKKSKTAGPKDGCGGDSSVWSGTSQISMKKFTQPNFMKSALASDKGMAIIVASIEMFLCFFDSPVRVNSLPSLHQLQTSCGSGILKYIPTDQKVWDIVESIDRDNQLYMEERLKMEPGNLTVGFDGVTALGKHATLYTLSKGAISLFLTIR